MSEHTPGPWRASMGDLLRVMHGSDCICGVHRIGSRAGGRRSEESEANARLIAAAPDLLAALQAVIAAPITGDHESIQRRDAAFTAARAAIAKATGGGT
jgi:hypothetical protein